MAASRLIKEDDLIRLRDIGYTYLSPGQKLFALSPDRQQLTFSMYRADPSSNAYCEAVYIFDRARGRLRQVDSGIELILEAYPIRGVRVDYGYPSVIVPAWSPDGKWLAYLKRAGGRTQIWRVNVDGEPAQRVSDAPIDVDRFTWTPDGNALVYQTRPGIADIERSIDQEGLRGFLFDERIVPYSSSRPAVTLPALPRYWRLDLRTGRSSVASEGDAALLAPLPAMDPAQNMRSILSASGRRTWTERRDPQAYLSTVDLWAEDRAGVKRRCPDSVCSGTRSFGIQQLWWAFGQLEVLFLRREGWGGSQTALFRWFPGERKARRLLLTDDLLLGCELIEPELICAREGSTDPRRLVSINVTTGREQLLVDPNPEFRAVKLGSVERLHWRSTAGVETFGDLVLPPNYAGQGRLPLVIVQYISTGFLRGGVGDEYPVQLFARQGYAVLSFHAPPAFATWDGSKKDFEQAVAQTSRDWSTRRMIFTSLESGIKLLIDRGIADPSRIGISGPSDGSTTVQFALINRPGLFAAASVSSCCTDPSFFMLYGGIGLAEERTKWGFPPARGPGSEAWQPLSLALNANSIKTPLLMQLADHEYLGGLDSFMSLRAARRPVELVVYPDEYHLMWQPAHRLAAYRRNLEWFDFWLRARADANPVDTGQYERWRTLQASAPH
ncbi:Atxe2 family lasso peptide isopeptidase [Novosphingobium sp. NBM11]|uniref:Atxe2 family lasso peptide isopeptidase n=1 Tax=Novosphingobium sp. NBM11 TaxID=2596914 RepID=UPI0018920A19|nr:Atxe2 family lasso peptide isopeptidase [Novosphingobium sp. NBM11]